MRRERAVLGSRTRRAVLSRRRWTKGGRWREAGVGAQGSAQRPWQAPLDAGGHCELLLLLLCLASHGACSCGERCVGSCGERYGERRGERQRRLRRLRRLLLCRRLRASGPRQALRTHIRQALRCSHAGAAHAAAHVRLRRWHTLDDARRRHAGRLEDRLSRLGIA